MATDVLIDSATHEPVPTDAAPPPDAQAPEPQATEAQDEGASRFEARIRELTEEVQGLRNLAHTAQARQATAPSTGWQPKPEYENHEVIQYLDRKYGQVFQQQQAASFALMNENDLFKARLNVDDTFGQGTWKKYGRQVEDAFQAELAKGTPEPREKIFYRLATEKSWKLTPVDEREERETQRRRRSGASLAAVPNTPPARRADQPKPDKPISAMTKDERDAAFQVYINQTGGF